jgi:DNA end-binding protein Ku
MGRAANVQCRWTFSQRKDTEMRSSWKGSVSAGLLSIPVSVGSTTSDGNGLALHQYAPDGGRIRLKRVSEKSGKEVAYPDIVTGYEAPNGLVIPLSDDDFAEAYGEKSRVAGIEMFADATSIPEEAKDKTYVIKPGEGNGKAYALLAATLRKTGRVAVTEFGIRARKSLAVISERDGYLYLTTLLWAEQVTKPDFDAPKWDGSDKELALAEQMVEAYAGTFEHSERHDDAADKLNAMLQARLEGKQKPAAEVAAERTGAALDLVAVLTASVEAARATREAAKPADETPVKPKTARTRKATTPRTRTASPVQAVPAANPTSPRRRTPARAAA